MTTIRRTYLLSEHEDFESNVRPVLEERGLTDQDAEELLDNYDNLEGWEIPNGKNAKPARL